MKNILIPLPNKDFDLTEVAVPWKLFKNKGYAVTFATQNSTVAVTDPLLITGVIFKQLGAKKQALQYYAELETSKEFLNPIAYEQIQASKFDALHLPGGHAKGMIPYLEDKVLQNKVLSFFNQNKTIGAICHGSIVLARTINPNTNKSIIYNKKITALTKILEQTAYYITAWKLGDYYRTYPEYVQTEVTRNLQNPKNFVTGNPFKPLVVQDENLITSRWPLDAYLYAQTLIQHLENKQ